MIFSAIPMVFASNGELSGNDSTDTPYIIEDSADLIKFCEMVNGTDSAEFCAELTNDITLTAAWVPFASKSGYPTTAYKGTFDGKGHKISGLNINSNTSNTGLFSVINGATVKNLRVSGTVSSTNNYVGGIVGKVQQGTIENCSFEGSVSSTKSGAYVGGIAGYIGNSATQTASVSGCVNKATVSGGTVGGITGYSKFSHISDCYNTGNITAASNNGGIVGNLQNKSTVTNCYSTGTLSGGTNIGDICGFNGSTIDNDSSVKNCCYKNEVCGGGTGTSKDCEKISSPEGLAKKLGSAFTDDTNSINGGYPILTWESGNSSEPKEPSVKISGNPTIKTDNSGTPSFTQLTAQAENIDDEVKFVWSVTSGDGIISIQAPENSDESNSKMLVYGDNPGKACVTVSTEDGKYTDSIDISVLPFITTVEIDGNVAVGRTVNARVNILGGSEYDYDSFPELKFQWKYLSSDDYSSGNTGYSAYSDISGAEEREFTIPSDMEGDYLSFAVTFAGEIKTPSSPAKIASAADGYAAEDASALTIDTSDIKAEKYITLPSTGKNGSVISWASSDENVIDPSNGKVTLPSSGISDIKLTASLQYNGTSDVKIRVFTVKVYSEIEAEKEKNDNLSQLESIIGDLDSYKIVPVFGEDSNVIDMLKSDLNRDDISVSIKNTEEVYGGADIKADGTIEYYYKNPNEEAAVHFGSFNVTFTLAIDDARKDFTVPIIIYHDADKVKEAIRTQIISETTLSADGKIIAEGDLTLSKIAPEKKWTLISWTSSNEDILRISNENQQTADTLFNPYVGKVSRGIKDEKVELTALYTYQYTNDVTGSEKPITLAMTYEVTVKALDSEGIAAKRAELAAKLEEGFATAGLRDTVSGEKLTDINGSYSVSNDILFPTTGDFRVDGKYTSVRITSDNSDAVYTYDVNNAARIQVIRPAPGKSDAVARITVSLSEKGTGISAEKTFKICVKALTDEEINAEKELMQRVKAAYFDGIKGDNLSQSNIYTNLSPFCEVYEKGGELVWVRANADTVNHGIIPVALDNWEELEAWRLFKSSNPSVISHENLLVTLKKNAKSVTVSSALSSETLGRYGELYLSDTEKYADYKDLADLYYQEVSADLTVRGTSTGRYDIPLATIETINVSFTLNGPDGTYISEVNLSNLPETTTAYDVFKKVTKDNGYTYNINGTGYGVYITSVTTPNGETISEFSYGKNSGWMYKINGYFADVAMTACGLNDGDSIEVFYSKDYLKEDYSKPGDDDNDTFGNGSSSGGSPSKKDDTTVTDTDKATENNNESTVSVSFNDIKGHWAEKEIIEICKRGILKGTDNNNFEPDSTLTRAMLVTILYRLENEPSVASAKFTDVKSDEWYSDAVAWAAENGIVNGVSENEFAPNDSITREQLAVMFYRYANYKKFDTSIQAESSLSYSDADSIDEYAKDALRWISESKIMYGKTDSTINSKDGASRAEIAVIVLRFLTKHDM